MLQTASGSTYHDWVTEVVTLPEPINGYYVIFHTIGFSSSLLSLLLSFFLCYFHFIHQKHGLFAKAKGGKDGIRPMPIECLVVFLSGFCIVDILWHVSLIYDWGTFLSRTLFFHGRYIVGYTGLVWFHAGIMYTLPTTILDASGQNTATRKTSAAPNAKWMNVYLISFSILAFFGMGTLAGLQGALMDDYGVFTAVWLGWTLLVTFFSVMIFVFGNKLVTALKSTIHFQRKSIVPASNNDSKNNSGNPPSLENSQTAMLSRRPSPMTASMQHRELKLKLLKVSLQQLQLTFTVLPLAAICFGLVNIINLFLWDPFDIGFYIPSTLHILSGPITILLVFLAVTFKASANLSIAKAMTKVMENAPQPKREPQPARPPPKKKVENDLDV